MNPYTAYVIVASLPYNEVVELVGVRFTRKEADVCVKETKERYAKDSPDWTVWVKEVYGPQRYTCSPLLLSRYCRPAQY